MGQAECMQILEKEDWISTVEIAKKLNQHNGVVARSLGILYRNGEILRKENRRGYEWKILK